MNCVLTQEFLAKMTGISIDPKTNKLLHPPTLPCYIDEWGDMRTISENYNTKRYFPHDCFFDSAQIVKLDDKGDIDTAPPLDLARARFSMCKLANHVCYVLSITFVSISFPNSKSFFLRRT